MVNVLRLLSRAAFAYDLKSVAYKPINDPVGTSIAAGASSGSYSAQVIKGPVDEAMAVFEHSTSTSTSATKTHTSKRPKHTGSSKVAAVADDACDVQPYDAPPVLDQEFAPFDQTTANVYRYRQQQSVNMGSWFVHENWMTPSLFSCAAGKKLSEIDIASGWGSPENAQAVLERHWDTFITESDFRYLSDIGINTVRLPIGYWSLGPDFTSGTAFESVGDVYRNCWPRIRRAVNQAAKHGLGVLVDLHGAVGSQNGQPHSGISDGQTGLFTEAANMDKTIKVLEYVMGQFAEVNNVVGVQVLNEPQAGNVLTDFYNRAIDAMRAVSVAATNFPIYVHDGFDLENFSDFVAKRTDFVVQDHHSYFVFTDSDKKESASQHTADVKDAISKALEAVSEKQHRNLVVDEWSCALSPSSTVNEADVDQVRKDFGHAQMKVYAKAAAGWSFWAYKKEDCDSDPGWCFKAAVGNSLPSTFFAYGQDRSRVMKKASNWATNGSDNFIMPNISPSLLNLENEYSDVSMMEPQQRRAGFRPNLAHRFESIYYRRGDSDAGSSNSDNGKNASTTRGYSDGQTTAKIFANNNGSRLGFSGQFMMDAMKVAGPSLIAVGTEDGYQDGFMRGLEDAEKMVSG